MPLISNIAAFQRRLADLPLANYEAGDIVLTAGSITGRLLILKEGAVVVVKEGVEIGEITTQGAVFGELSVLLDRPHTADVVAVKASQFYVVNAASPFMQDPVVLLYVAAVLAGRLDRANKAVIHLKGQIEDGESFFVIGKTVQTIERALGVGGASRH
jgi:CRP/FNR family transcriptional regulator, cyclic AMP receptor protein